MAAFPSPPHLRLPIPALCLTAHPSTPSVAIGLSSSGIVISSLPSATTPCPPSLTPVTHPLDDACLALSFIPSSPHLLASARHLHLLDISTPTPLHSYKLPAPPPTSASPIATTFTPIDAHLALAGDDVGGIHLLDLRVANTPVATVLEQGDHITQLVPVERFDTRAILSASGDGTLCAYDLRRPPHARLRLQYAADAFQDDVLSLCVLEEAPVAVGGTLSGALNLYNLRFLDKEADAEAAAHVDRFYGHPECVNAVVGCGGGGVVTASSDGIVRVVDVVNKALVGVLEYEMEGGGGGTSKKKGEAWPVESMVAMQGMGKPCFALLGHDEMIRFCDGGPLVEEGEEEVDGETNAGRVEEGGEREEEETERVEMDQQSGRGRKKRRKTFENEKKLAVAADFFDDL